MGREQRWKTELTEGKKIPGAAGRLLRDRGRQCPCFYKVSVLDFTSDDIRFISIYYRLEMIKDI